MLVTGKSLDLPLTLLGWPLLATLVSVGAVTIGLVALPYQLFSTISYSGTGISQTLLIPK